jgi:GntR family transcriptional repressor for pyruvate dehydrogenase complex
MAAPMIDQAIEHIRDLIVRGALEPGSKLPPEPELAAILGCSRSTVREAVRSLVMARVLDVRRGDGTYVTSLRPELLLDGIGFATDLMRDESLPELWEIRMLLEPPATAKAAEKISDGRLVELAEILEQMRRSADDDSVLVRHDAWFHELVAQAAGNHTLASLLGNMSSRTMTLEEKAAQLTSAWLGDEPCDSDVAPMQGEFTGRPELPATWAATHSDAIGADLADRQHLPHT